MKVCERGNKSGLSSATVDSTVAKEKALDLLFIFFWNSSNPFTFRSKIDFITNFVFIFLKVMSRFEIQVQHSPITNRSADKTKNALPIFELMCVEFL